MQKNGSFSSSYERIGKNGNVLFLMLFSLFDPLFISEHQYAGLINQLDSEIVESLFEVASLCNSVVSLEGLELLETQREEKLRRQKIIKENHLEHSQNDPIQNLL